MFCFKLCQTSTQDYKLVSLFTQTSQTDYYRQFEIPRSLKKILVLVSVGCDAVRCDAVRCDMPSPQSAPSDRVLGCTGG